MSPEGTKMKHSLCAPTWTWAAVLLTSLFAPANMATLNAQEQARQSPPAKRILVNGIDLAYVEEGRGEPVVLIHGFLFDYRVWCAQVPDLSKHYRVIAYSKRYRWPNTLTGDGSDVSKSVDEADLVALIRRLKLGRVHLVGHSAGAGVALQFAYDHPELVRTLVLGEPGPQAVAVNTAEAKLPFTPELIGEIRRSYERGDNEGALRLVAEAVTGEKGARERITPCAWSIALDNIWELKDLWTPRLQETPLTCAQARRIKLPILLLGGDRSPRILQLVLDGLEKCLPTSERAVLPESSHGLEVENPAGFNKIVLEFLARHSGRAANRKK
jgi:non-heme chloroperoxidase